MNTGYFEHAKKSAKAMPMGWVSFVRRWHWLALSLICLTLPVNAHANLAAASPEPNARLDTSPAAIRLTFTEPPEPAFSRIRLLDLSGKELLSGGEVPTDDPHTLVLPLTSTLPDDVYTVVWQTVSAGDGHSTRGSYVFGVGMAAGTRSTVVIDETFDWSAAIARSLTMAGTILTLGVFAFAGMVWRPGLTQGLPARHERFERVMWAGWLLYGLSLPLGLLAQASTATGGTIIDVITDGSAIRLLSESSSALVWLGRIAVWIAFGAALYFTGDRPLRGRLLVVLGLGLAVLPSLISHARAAGSADSLINDMLHRITAALWIGGLAGWTAALWGEDFSNIKAIGRAVSRFSNYARFYVLLLAGGGLFAAIQYIPSSDALLDTGYGRALTAKGVLFGLMFALAGFNLLFAERRLKRGEEGWVRVLIATVGAELSLGMALMLMSAIMAVTVPSRDVIALRTQAAEQSASPRSAPYFGMEIEDDIMVHLEISPGLAGENEFVIAPYLLPDTLPLEDASRVRLRFTHATQNLGESTLEATRRDDGTYTAEGANLSIPGTWRVRLTIQRPGAFDSVIDFDVTIKE